MTVVKVTVNDVAREANVSPATVSRVFNKNPNISEETRELVLKTAAKLGYKPRVRKSEGRESSKKNIAIVFNNRLSSLTDDPFYGQVIAGIEQIVSHKNYNLFFRTVTGHLNSDLERIETLISDEKLAGIILAGYEIDEQLVKQIKKNNLPLVLVDSNLYDENVNMILNDNTTGARAAVDYLITLGHRRIAFVGGPLNHTSLDERYIGYKQALRRAGIKKNEEYITFCKPRFDAEDGYRATLAMLKSCNPMPTAIFAANDMLAIGAMRAVFELGLSIPHDISVVGFDDISMAQHTIPQLTTVRIQKHEMGMMAAKRLLELIDEPEAKPIKVIVGVELVVRDSVAERKDNSTVQDVLLKTEAHA